MADATHKFRYWAWVWVGSMRWRVGGGVLSSSAEPEEGRSWLVLLLCVVLGWCLLVLHARAAPYFQGAQATHTSTRQLRGIGVEAVAVTDYIPAALLLCFFRAPICFGLVFDLTSFPSFPFLTMNMHFSCRHTLQDGCGLRAGVPGGAGRQLQDTHRRAGKT